MSHVACRMFGVVPVVPVVLFGLAVVVLVVVVGFFFFLSSATLRARHLR